MQVYLPVAEISVDATLVLALGTMVGFLSGLFGVGGGFLMTPMLMFIGVPPAIAVGTQANQLVAASVSGVLAHWRKRNVDLKMGVVMLIGSSGGNVLGNVLFRSLKDSGQIDLVIALLYVSVLGTIGGLMLVESLFAMLKGKKKKKRGKLHKHTFLHGLPFRMRFNRSRLYVSAFLPGGIGFVGGFLVALMGIGGGFLLVPAMIYLLGMPAALVAGTSLFQIIFTTGQNTIMQAVMNHTVDVMLAFLLIAGGVIGAQFGTRMGGVMRGEHARALLGSLVLLVSVRLAFDLFIPPADLFSIEVGAIQ